jgi:hypothetical protein
LTRLGGVRLSDGHMTLMERITDVKNWAIVDIWVVAGWQDTLG